MMSYRTFIFSFVLFLSTFVVLQAEEKTNSSPSSEKVKHILEFRLESAVNDSQSQEYIIKETGEHVCFFTLPALTEEDVARAVVELDDINSSIPPRKVIMIRFTPAGSKKLAQVTAANIRKKMGIFYEGRLISAPMIMDEIKNGEAVIYYPLNDTSEMQKVAENIQKAASSKSSKNTLKKQP